MKKRQLPSDNDIYQTLGNRSISAFGSIFFSLPLCGLFWILSRGMMSMPVSICLIGLLALLGFISPRLLPDIFAWVLKVVFDVMKFWW
jgi:hypothetical protein